MTEMCADDQSDKGLSFKYVYEQEPAWQYECHCRHFRGRNRTRSMTRSSHGASSDGGAQRRTQQATMADALEAGTRTLVAWPAHVNNTLGHGPVGTRGDRLVARAPARSRRRASGDTRERIELEARKERRGSADGHEPSARIGSRPRLLTLVPYPYVLYRCMRVQPVTVGTYSTGALEYSTQEPLQRPTQHTVQSTVHIVLYVVGGWVGRGPPLTTSSQTMLIKFLMKCYSTHFNTARGATPRAAPRSVRSDCYRVDLLVLSKVAFCSTPPRTPTRHCTNGQVPVGRQPF